MVTIDQRMRALYSCAVCCLFLSLAAPVRAVDMLTPGIDAKLSAGAGQTVQTGAPALFYNPANCFISHKYELYGDVSALNVKYTYAQSDPKYAPTTLSITAPPVLVGFSWHPISFFSLAAAIEPTGIGTQEAITSLPVILDGSSSPDLVDVYTANSGFNIALGAAFGRSHILAGGIGIIIFQEKDSINAVAAGQPSGSTPVFSTDYSGTNYQFLLGVRSELMHHRNLILGGSVKLPTVMRYSGTSNVAGVASSQVPTGYQPLVVGGGIEYRFRNLTGFFDYTREEYSLGRNAASSGYDGSTGTDYIDSNNFVAGGRVSIVRRHLLIGAAGYYESFMGYGTPIASQSSLALDTSTASNTMDGHTFQSGPTAIPRYVVAGGYEYRFVTHGYIATGVSYTTGSRTVPSGYPGEGTYSLQMIGVSFGGAFAF